MAKESLDSAKENKQDEFYTQFSDIEREINAYLEYNPDVFKGKTILLPCDDPEWSSFTRYFAKNFAKLGLKKLISTSYAPNSKPREIPYQPALFELESPDFDNDKTRSNGKIFTLIGDKSGDTIINEEDLDWEYLEGDGDFRSEEVTKLRDQADVIITNPPFSLFREFLAWVVRADKEFAVIANKTAITYKEVFPLIQENKMWPGSTPMGADLLFSLPEYIAGQLVRDGKEGSKWKRVEGKIMGRSSSVWFTNIEHKRRHEELALLTTAENIKHSKNPSIQGIGYQKYENCDAIDVPRVEAIPDDHYGLMGVPVTFLGKFNPDQFELVRFRHGDDGKDLRLPGGKTPFFRILIKRKQITK
jgi:hypothetical protein